VALDAGQEATLVGGQPVYTQIEGAAGGRGVAVFLVNAPPDKVWATIRSFPSYTSWIDGVSACEIYKTEGEHVFVRFELKKMGMGIEYFIDHTYPPGADWGTWTLDYDRESDLDDSVGMWRVTPDASGKTRVEYSVDIQISGWVPGFIREMIVDRGIRDATTWVKVQSEG
jgi:ribosome-associated toxin RatA of RatAB toxin-antitoxin module